MSSAAKCSPAEDAAEAGPGVSYDGPFPVKVKDLKTRAGAWLSKGQLVGVVQEDNEKGACHRVKADRAGKVVKWLVKKGDRLEKATCLVRLSTACTHPTLMKDMCAECGADLRQEAEVGSGPVGGAGGATSGGAKGPAASAAAKANISMVHSIPELRVSKEEAQTLGREDEQRLRRHRKLVLLVDLDQTLIHTTNETIPANIKDVYHFQLHGDPKAPWYHTRIRPQTKRFLESVSKLYELHICTFGARLYAHTIAGFLDPNSKYFSHRILSRDECFDNRSKTANLSSLFPCGDHMVCIIDDREDVWNFAPNLVHVKPYHFFKNTGDINAPPGLEKKENDGKGSQFKVKQKQSVKAGAAKSEAKPAKPEAKSAKSEAKSPENAEAKPVKSEAKPAKSLENASTSSAAKEDTAKAEDKAEKSESAKEGEEKMEVDKEAKEAKEAKETEKKNEETVSDDLELSDDDDDDDDKDNNAKGSSSSGGGSLEEGEVPNSKKEEEDTDPAGGEDDLVEIEDNDDYLLHLEDILTTIHKAYYELSDQMSKTAETEKPPDLKTVVPYVKRKVLQGQRMVFSGIVPTHVPLRKSKAYMLARSLGATVTEHIERDGPERTTHLIAARLGTAKVNDARKLAGDGDADGDNPIHVVTPDWLWCCAERWARIDERLFPLTKQVRVTLRPPAHCSSPEIAFAERCGERSVATLDGSAAAQQRMRTERQNSTDSLPETMNPFMAMSKDDLQGMDKEVEEMLSGDSDSSSDDDDDDDDEPSTASKRPADEGQGRGHSKAGDDEEEEGRNSSSDESLNDAEAPKGWTSSSKRRRVDQDDDDDDDDDDDEEDEGGDELDSMAQELEREFLGDGDGDEDEDSR